VRVNTIANTGAYLQVGSTSFIGNIGTLAGVYKTPTLHADITCVFTNTNPVRPYRGNGRPEAGYVIERLVDLAADQLGLDPVELRRRNTIPPSRRRTDRADLHLRQRRVREEHGHGAADGRRLRLCGAPRAIAQAWQAARARHLQHDREAAAPSYEGAEIRFDRSGTATLFSGSSNHGQGHETAFKQIVCDRLGLDPNDVNYVKDDTDQVFFGGHRRFALGTIGGAAVLMATDKIRTKATAIAAHVLKVAAEDVRFEDGIFSSPKTNQTVTIKDIAKVAAKPDQLPKTIEAGLIATASTISRSRTIPTAATSARSRSTRRPARSSEALQRGRRRRHRDQPAAGARADRRRVAQGAGQILMEDIHFDTESGQLVTGSFMDYAMPRASDLSASR